MVLVRFTDQQRQQLASEPDLAARRLLAEQILRGTAGRAESTAPQKGALDNDLSLRFMSDDVLAVVHAALSEYAERHAGDLPDLAAIARSLQGRVREHWSLRDEVPR